MIKYPTRNGSPTLSKLTEYEYQRLQDSIQFINERNPTVRLEKPIEEERYLKTRIREIHAGYSLYNRGTSAIGRVGLAERELKNEAFEYMLDSVFSLKDIAHQFHALSQYAALFNYDWGYVNHVIRNPEKYLQDSLQSFTNSDANTENFSYKFR